jgi:CubicO group peptidase (beta-lactamase class C family)
LPPPVALWRGERDEAIAAKMREMIAANEVPGAVTVVATKDGVSHLGVIGHAEAGKKRALRKDSIFWIASMTKPVTAVAVMMMQDEGKLSIDDPVSKYIPEFGANGVTLRHMLTHTSGMGEATPSELASARTLAEMVPIYAKKPLGFAPGSQWKYCQSGINMLGRVVEIVSGMTLDKFFDKRLFKSLGMKDTGFYLSGKQMSRWLLPRGGTQMGWWIRLSACWQENPQRRVTAFLRPTEACSQRGRTMLASRGCCFGAGNWTGNVTSARSRSN